MHFPYKRLSGDMQSLATQICVAESMFYFHAKNCSEFIKELKRRKSDTLQLTSEVNSGFWYKKLSGQKILRATKLERLHNTVPYASQILNHSLFQLLDSNNASFNERRLLSALKQEIKDKLFNGMKRESLYRLLNKDRYQLYLKLKALKGESLDEVTVLLLVYAITDNEKFQREIEISSFSCVCNLCQSKYPDIILSPLVKAISQFIDAHQVSKEADWEGPFHQFSKH